MSKSVHRSCHPQTEALQSHTPSPDVADRPSDKPAPRDARDERNLLDRILSTPLLERAVPQLQPDLLHRVIQICGLEDCSELVALATPGQLAQIFDLDLWRAAQPGRDEQFDADRFGVWLEVLVESGAVVAAQKLAGIDVDLVVAGLAQHALVYDHAAVTPYETLDGELVDAIRDIGDGLVTNLGGYVLVARRADSWEAIVEVLLSLDAGHPDYFHQVMMGCRALSNSGREIDGLDDLFADGDQVMFDLSVDREKRREKKGYVMPAPARAFLQMSRQLQLGSDSRPPANPLTRAYFRDIDNSAAANSSREAGLLEAGPAVLPALEDTAEVVAAVYDVLQEAGVLTPPPRALLGGAEDQQSRLSRMQSQMQYVFEHDQTASSMRSEELVYLANTLMAGCSIQTRPFTPQEAMDAAVAVCNLGLENWPPHWVAAEAALDSFLVDHDLICVFQVGWTVLHRDVCLYTAEQLIAVLRRIRCEDREIQTGLDELRNELARDWQAGAPWRARDALDVIATLDLLAWFARLALIDECPVLHACVGASKDSRTLSFSATDFEFISENSQISSVREFMRSLPETLGG
jgi:hypothetical protein